MKPYCSVASLALARWAAPALPPGPTDGGGRGTSVIDTAIAAHKGKWRGVFEGEVSEGWGVAEGYM